jgi:hypothetical protein
MLSVPAHDERAIRRRPNSANALKRHPKNAHRPNREPTGDKAAQECELRALVRHLFPIQSGETRAIRNLSLSPSQNLQAVDDGEHSRVPMQAGIDLRAFIRVLLHSM